MKLTPILDQILIRPLAAPKSESGLYLPPTGKQNRAQVMAIGTDPKIPVKVGQKVLYKRWDGNEVKQGNETWYIIQMESLLAILDENDPLPEQK